MKREGDDRRDCLSSGGLCGLLARAVDWSTTPLGPVSSWSTALQNAVRLVLESREPLFLSWGVEHALIANDAFIAHFADQRCRWPMGVPAKVAWPVVWPVLGPRLDAALEAGKPCFQEDEQFLVRLDGSRRTREAYWTYSLTPIRDDDGRVGGVLGACVETTARVYDQRRGHTFRTFFDRIAKLTNPCDITPMALSVLREQRWDVAFAWAFAMGTDGVLRPHATTLSPNTPEAVNVDFAGLLCEHIASAREANARTPLSVATVSPVHLSKADSSAFGDEPVTQIVVGTVPSEGAGYREEVIVYGLNPRIPYDDAYRSYLERFTEKIALTRGRIVALRAWAAAECERRDLLLQSPLPTVLITGPDNVFELVNPAFQEIVGQNLIGKKYLDAFPHLTDAEITKAIERARKMGEGLHLKEQLLPADPRRGTDDRWVNFTVQPIRDAAGDVYGLMVVAVDITETMKARHAFEKLNSEREKLLDALEAANRSKDEFLAMLGHELRNPLAPIHTALHLMKRKDPFSLLREREIIERQAAHLAHLVDDLLDVARVARGKVTLNASRIAIGKVIGHAVETASPLFEQKCHVLTVDAPEVGLDVLGDPLRLGQVFANLLTNAAKFTEPAGRISIRAERDGDFAVVRVEDNGSGISPEQLPHLFDTFFQGPRARDRAQGGLGLGLALVQSLVALHGGSVAVTSDGLGAGSVFEVRLPALPIAARAEAPPLLEDYQVRPSNGRRVLLVDDSEDILEIVSALLRYEGYEVLAAPDGPTALQVAPEFHPDIAVLDIGLPAMDGYDLARHLREELGDRTPKLVAMTGYGQAADTERAREAGFDVHLVKPVDPEQLLASLV